MATQRAWRTFDTMRVIGSILISTVSLAACFAMASTPEHSPFTNGDKISAIPMRPGLVVVKAKLDAARTTQAAPIKAPRTSKNEATAYVERSEDKKLKIRLFDADAHLVAAAETKMDDALVELSLHTAELNGDKRQDFILTVRNNGCGLGAEIYDEIVVLSGPKGYTATILRDGCFFNPEDFIRLPDTGKNYFIHTRFCQSDEGESKDGKFHSFFLNRLFRIDGDKVVECRDDGRFPMTIWYNQNGNHRETSLISPATKARLLKENAANPEPLPSGMPN